MANLAILAIIIYWVGLFIIFKKWGVLKSSPISDHVARGKSRLTWLLFGGVYTLLMSFFLWFWLLPKYNAVFIDYAALFLGIAGLVGTLIVPRKDKSTSLHDRFADVLGVCLLSLFGHLVSMMETSGYKLLFSVLFVISLIVGVFLVVRHTKRYLYFQTSYYAFFHLYILLMTYF